MAKLKTLKIQNRKTEEIINENPINQNAELISFNLLEENPLNDEYFRGNESYDLIKKSLQEDKMKTPLRAYKTESGKYRLKAGNTRLKIIKELMQENPAYKTKFGRLSVIVEPAPESREAEIKDIVMDNVARRMLNKTQRQSLLVKLYPELLGDDRGGNYGNKYTKNNKIKEKNIPKSPEKGLGKKISEAAKTFNVSEGKIKKDRAEIRKKIDEAKLKDKKISGASQKKKDTVPEKKIRLKKYRSQLERRFEAVVELIENEEQNKAKISVALNNLMAVVKKISGEVGKK